MRGYRALLIALFVLVVAVILLLYALFRRHDKLITVVSSQGLVGGYAVRGDTLMFTTYYPHDPGYIVHFVSTPYPCGKDANGKDITKIPVTADRPGSCKVTLPQGEPSSNVSFFYTLELNAPSLATQVMGPASGSTGQSGQNDHPSSAVPCRLCAVMGVGNTGDSGVETMKNSAAGSSHVTELITCGGANNDTATVGDAVVVLGTNAAISWLGNRDWNTSAFIPNTQPSNVACSNGTAFSSAGNPTFCAVETPGSYTYSVHLDSCPKGGTGNLTITAPTQTHP